MAFTELVAPACKVRPMASTKMPGMNKACDPSMRMPPRPDHAQMGARLGECRPDFRGARHGDGEGEHGVQVEARGGDQRDAQYQGDAPGPAQVVERLPVEGMGLQVDQGG